jgi:hypothetical protein
MHLLKAVGCAAALTVLIAPGARADEWNKKTILTFSGPVQIPGATLPAGSYVFKLADIAGNRHVVQVFDKDERKIFTTMLAIPNERLDPSDKPVVLFSERASGSPQAVKVWFYPGERIGNEFVYPKTQAMRIAKETHQSVLAMNEDTNATSTASEVPSAMKTAEVGHFDENGNWKGDDKKVAVNNAPAASNTNAAGASASSANPAPATAPQTTTASNQARPTTTPAPQTTASNQTRPTTTRSTTAGQARSNTAGTSGVRPARTHLPRTGSELALFELLSGLSLAAGFGVRRLRTRA